ncbi:MAG: DUF2326 domain-containing protein [Candidatus Parabeggiatoa sp. nov. 1]|nr:MAG: DUF2326 domain-containing protein [Gammaproteobacteria bacterium]
MKLIKLTASQPSFKNIHFNPEGITLIVGDGPKEKNKEGRNNGVGKTLALGLVHHCLGAKVNPKLKETIPDWFFQLHLSLNGKAHFVERSADGKKLILDEKSIKLNQYREWLNNCGTFRIDENLSGLSFRSLFTRFARLLREDCDAPIKTHKEPEVDANLRTLYLLGIDCILVAQKKAQKKRLDELKHTLNTWKNAHVLHEVFRAGSQPKIRLEWLEREIPRLKADLKRFKVAENYRAIEAEAQEKTEFLRQIEKPIAVLRFQIEGINKALQQQPDISSAELLQLYEGLQSVFKPEALANFEAVEQFHHGLAFNRKVRLEADRKKFSLEIEQLATETQKMGQERDKLLRTLEGQRALDEYATLAKRIAQWEAEQEKLTEYLAFADKLEQERQAIKEKMLAENQEANRYLQTAPVKPHHEFFVAVAERLYPHTPAGILLNNNLGVNQLRYNLSVQIEGDDSDGINSARILCFDWVLLMQGANHTMDFVWHDNRLFADMDPKSRTGWFKYTLEALLGSGKQYIATLNIENYEAMREYLDDEQWNKLAQSKVLVLRGDKPDNKLLGIQFGGY